MDGAKVGTSISNSFYVFLLVEVHVIKQQIIKRLLQYVGL